MNEHDFENKLKDLKLTRTSENYLDKGLAVLQVAQTPRGFWQRYMPAVLALALVVSVSANVFQLVNDRQPFNTTDRGEQLTQCTTPTAAASPVPSQDFEIATLNNTLKPLGMC